MPAGDAQATPGQAAHDGWWDALPHRRNHPDYAPYDKESAEDRRAWDAAAEAVAGPLRAELTSLRESAQLQRMHHDELAASYRKLQGERDAARADLARLRIAAAERDRALDDLASFWEHGDKDKYPEECARELREALEGGGEHGRYDAEGKWHPASQPWPGDVSDLDEGGGEHG